MEVFVIVVGLVLFAMLFRLGARVRKLEQTIKTGVLGHSLDVDEGYQQQTPQPSLVVADKPMRSAWGHEFIAWVKDNWMLKLGALLLLIGFGWLATYAFLNNWIGPMGRIAIGIIAGALFLLLGWWRIQKYLHQGGIFLALGSTTILLTVFAGRGIYDFFTPFSALALMFLSVVFVALMSVKYNSKSLALMSLVLAGIAPLLTNAPSPDYIGLFSYLLIVILGAIWVAAVTENRALTIAALLLVVFYSLPHLVSSTSADTGALLLFAYAFSAVFFLANTAGILNLKNKRITADLLTAAGNGLFLLVWILVAAPKEWQSLIISVWMVVFVAGAFLIFKATNRREPFYVYAGVGVTMLVAATAVELSGVALTIAYIVEAGLIPMIIYVVTGNTRIAERASLLLIGPIILSFSSITSNAWRVGVFHKDFFILFLLGLTMFGLGILFAHSAQEDGKKGFARINALLLIGGSIYAYILLWLSLGASFKNADTAVMLSLIVYTIIGLAVYFYGLSNDNKALRVYGGLLLGFVVGRLLVVDIWNMELTGRIITFFSVGALLVSTAFLGRNKQVSEKPDYSNDNNTSLNQ